MTIWWSLAATQLFHCSVKAETIHIQMIGCVPIKLQKQAAGQIWLKSGLQTVLSRENSTYQT